MGREKPTLIEKLDRRYPGLAAQVNLWFEQGLDALAIANLLEDRYHVPVTESSVGSYRCRRWVRKREARAQQRLNAQARGEGERHLALEPDRAASYEELVALKVA